MQLSNLYIVDNKFVAKNFNYTLRGIQFPFHAGAHFFCALKYSFQYYIILAQLQNI